jgi:hypothetical protein
MSNEVSREPESRDRAQASATTNGFAVASLVLGIVWLMGVGSILALVFGYIAKAQIDQSGDGQIGHGLAVAGIVLGWVGVGFLILMIVSASTGWMPWMSRPMDMMGNMMGGMGS